MTAISENYRKRAIEARNETVVCLNKELSYSIELQNTKRIENLKLHIENLDNMIRRK